MTLTAPAPTALPCEHPAYREAGVAAVAAALADLLRDVVQNAPKAADAVTREAA